MGTINNNTDNLIISFIEDNAGKTHFEIKTILSEQLNCNYRHINKLINELTNKNILEYYNNLGQSFIRKSFNKIVKLSDNVNLVPENFNCDSKESQKPGLCVKISSGTSFGNGTHPTTKLCVEILDSLLINSIAKKDWQILDIGTGSGILSVICSIYGISNIHSCDNDERSLYEASENFKLNNLSSRFQLINDFEKSGFNYNLIIANLRYPTLLDFKERIYNKLVHNGYLIISGIKDEEYDFFLDHFINGFETKKSLSKNGWSALQLIKI